MSAPLERLRGLLYEDPLDAEAVVDALGGRVREGDPRVDYLVAHLPHRDDGEAGWRAIREPDEGPWPKLALVEEGEVVTRPASEISGVHLQRVDAWGPLALVRWAADATDALWDFALTAARDLVKEHAASDLNLLTTVEQRRLNLNGQGDPRVYRLYRDSLREVYSGPEQAVRGLFADTPDEAIRAIAQATFNASRILAMRRGEPWVGLQQEALDALDARLEERLLELEPDPGPS